MDKDALLQHKKDLLDIYTKNLQILEKQEALNAQEVDIRISNEINETREKIARIQSELHSLEEEEHRAIKPVPYPLEKYEFFIASFTDRISKWNKTTETYEVANLNGLKHAVGAQQVFIAKYSSGDWKISGDVVLDEKEIRAKYIQSDSFNYILNVKTGDGQAYQSLYYIDNIHGANLSLLLPFGFDNTTILVFHDLSNEIVYDKAFELILKTIIADTKNFTDEKPVESLELSIHNRLRERFGYVSDAMFNRQYDLFYKELERMSVEFEPIIHIHPDAPGIYGWEALARDPSRGLGRSEAPKELFETADIWGTKFQLQLDIYFLIKAIDLYTIDNGSQASKDVSASKQYRRKHTMLPLSVNVNPSSLLEKKYRETIQTLSRQSHMPLNKLYLEISEKDQIPAPQGWDGKQNVIEAYKEELNFYRDLDIHFSIDDFGVGYSSSSRVSRLGPAIVKIDRDALIDNFGNFTLNFVVSLARRLPGEIKVIIEGYDKESALSLRKLFDLGVLYVQGHEFGKARSIIDDRLSKELVEKIKSELA